MGTADKTVLTAAPAAKLTKEERLAQAQAYAEQFKFEKISPEELKKIRRNAYAYLL